MALSAILAGLRTALDGVAGATAVYTEVPEAPAAVAAFPAIVLQVLPAIEYQPSNVSFWIYPIDVIYLYKERGAQAINQDLADLFDVPAEIVAALNAASTLGGKVYGPQFAAPAADIGALGWRDKTYSGCRVHLRPKEKSATSYSG